jgi:hypothetical protein
MATVDDYLMASERAAEAGTRDALARAHVADLMDDGKSTCACAGGRPLCDKWVCAKVQAILTRARNQKREEARHLKRDVFKRLSR